MQRLGRLEQELNSIDMVSRRCNLNFFGVREPTSDNYSTNADVIVDVLNADMIVDVLNESGSSRT